LKISIIIPSYNQGAYLEETLNSVLQQKEAEFEVIVIDGGSTDETLPLLERYSNQISYWESTPDRGQTHAINKGLKRISGDVWAYLNSDDLLVPGALATVSRHFQSGDTLWLSGGSDVFDHEGTRGVIEVGAAHSLKDYLTSWNRCSKYVFPFSGACFMHKAVMDKIGFFDENFNYSMDMEYYCRAIFAGIKQTVVPERLARWRWHAESKTSRKGIAFGFRHDEILIAEKFANKLPQDERRELEKELEEQQRWLVVREAMWLHSEGNRAAALSLIISSLRTNPLLVTFRPWLGALRRICTH
jgi:glycosyltransferase involved in cell wall biosynthesis